MTCYLLLSIFYWNSFYSLYSRQRSLSKNVKEKEWEEIKVASNKQLDSDNCETFVLMVKAIQSKTVEAFQVSSHNCPPTDPSLTITYIILKVFTITLGPLHNWLSYISCQTKFIKFIAPDTQLIFMTLPILMETIHNTVCSSQCDAPGRE